MEILHQYLVTNLTSINSNIAKLGNQSINLSLMSKEYFKNLTTDNPQLAQLIYKDIKSYYKVKFC